MESTVWDKRLLIRPQVFQPRLPGVSVPRCLKKDDGMSAIQTWTLWQRMPPRYQLTSRFYDEDADISLSITSEKFPSGRGSASPSRPTSGIDRQQHQHPRPKLQTSVQRPTSGTLTPRKQTTLTSSYDDSLGFVLSSRLTETNKKDAHQEHHTDSRTSSENVSNHTNSTSKYQNKLSFPKRKSDYINNFQRQKRVNSARRRLAESPPNEASPPSHLGPSRAQTAPVYPVTNPEVCSTQTIRFNNETRNVNDTTRKTRSSTETTKIDMFQFEDPIAPTTQSRGMVKFSSEKQPKAKKYLIQDTNRSTMYIDNGKVICFGKSRHDLTQLLKTQSLRRDRNKSFFSELRRDYLTHPKYDINRNKEKLDIDPRRVAYERIDYNRKVENILNYYSDEDGSPSPSPPPSRPSSRYRVRSPTGGRVKGLSLTMNAPSRPPSRSDSPVPEVVSKSDGFGDYIKLNKQSKLYDRKFYLRTPAMKHEGLTEKQLANCRCSICRIKLQLSIVTGANKGHVNNDGNLQGNNSTHQDNKPHNGQHHTRKTNGTGMPINDVNTSDKGDKSSQLKVTFQQPEMADSGQEQHTLTISCTLPEMQAQSEIASESGFESSRTVVSVAKTETNV